MIISASRRTDIPAFYTKWFMNRIRAGYCTVPNPLNPTHVTQVSLRPADVDVIVFWTRDPRPLLPHLPELNDRGYRYYFQYTIMNNPLIIDPKTPSLRTSLRTFRDLSVMIGAEKMIWRYDPIVFSTITTTEFHQKTFECIARELKGYAQRCVISVVDIYRKVIRRLNTIKEKRVELVERGRNDRVFQDLMRSLVLSSKANAMEIVSCAEEEDLQSFGIRPGKCVDDEYIQKIFGITMPGKKDPSQRKRCRCVVSKDIGMYDTCLFNCWYCYATNCFEQVKKNYRDHDPGSPSLIP